MPMVKLGEVAKEHKETCKGDKGDLPIVGLEHLIPEDINLTCWSDDKENTFTKMFRKGHVLFGRRRAYLKKAAVAPFDGICSGDITVIEAIEDKLYPGLLPFIIQNDALFDFAVEKSAGSLSPRVKWQHLQDYEFFLPEMAKQKELAELLWAIDRTKQAYKQLISATDELVKSQFIAINSTEKKKPVEEDKYTYLGLEHLDTGSLTVTRFGSDVAPIGEKLVMKKGDVLFGKRRAYQKKVAIAPFDGIFSAHGMVLRPKEDVIDKDFFPLFISSDYFLDAAIKISVGSLSPTINWRDLKVLEFELPPLEEQRKLAKALWAVIRTIEAYKELLKKTDELVKSQFIEMFGNPLTNERGWHSALFPEVTDIVRQNHQNQRSGTAISDGLHPLKSKRTLSLLTILFAI